MGELLVPTHAVILLLVPLLTVFPLWRIFTRLGYSGAIALLMLVPVVNILTLYIVAFSGSRERGVTRSWN
jgi:hypothetical protein